MLDARGARKGDKQTFLLSNIRGILGQGGNSKTGFLFDQAISHQAMIVAVTETWLKPDIKDAELLVNFPGYSLYRSDRLIRKCGGVCAFIRDDISAECIGTYDNGVCELLVLKVHSLNVVLVLLYRPPDTKIAEFTPALSELDKILGELSGPTSTLFFMGDLNFPSSVMSWHTIDGQLIPSVHGHRGDARDDGGQARLQAQKFSDLALKYHTVQLVSQPTHGTEILDLVYTSDQNTVSHIEMDSFPTFTDHKVLAITVTFHNRRNMEREEMFLLDSSRRIRKLDFRKAPWPEIKSKLRTVDWSPMARLARLSPIIAHSWFLVKLLPVLEELVPTRVESCGTGGRSRLHRKSKKLWRKLAKIKSKLQNSTSIQKIVKLLQDRQDVEFELKNMYSSITKVSEDKVIAGMKENINVFFSYAKARQKVKAKVGPFIDPTTGELNLDPDYTAKCLSEQYSSVFTSPRQEWDIPDMSAFFRIDNTSPTGPIFTDLDFTEDDIEFACSELCSTSAAGPDGIPASLLKVCRKELKKPLFLLWRASLSQGVIPPDLLLVLISPVHKGGSRADPAQYRPVALTSHIVKVFERVLRKGLVAHLEAQGFLPTEQHGFREFRSTLTQLLTHWDKVLDHLESGDTVDVIYTDFSKAFDKCETNVLLHTLRDCGVKGRVGKWIAAFLSPHTRKQVVGVEGRISPLVPVVSGVPQGTVLGPILFLIHIRGISAKLSQGTSSSSFADDTRIMRGVRSTADCAQLQADLQTVYDWAEEVNMKFNSSKFEWVRYTASKEAAPVFVYLGPDKSAIEQKDNLRDLGVRLSSNLSFSLQVEKAVSSASQMVGWGLRTFRGRNSFLLLTVFKSLVQPHLDYCSQLWSPTSQEQINKIERVQKSLVSRVSDTRLQGLSYWDKLSTLRLYSQERRRERYMIIFVWKISQGLVSGYTIPFTSPYNRTGRKAILHHAPQSATASVRQARAGTLAVRGAQLFNAMPSSLRNSDHGDVLMFKNHLDIYLLNIPDQPTVAGLTRAAQSNSLLHQVPLYEASY